jgi:teichuronic acid biosynthesis glycosyltransferase TuaC
VRILSLCTGFPSEANPQHSIFVWNQMRALIARGHEFRVVRILPWAPAWTSKWRYYRSLPARYEWEGQPVITLRAFVAPKHLSLSLTKAQIDAPIRREIVSFKPDLIHAHAVIPAGCYASGFNVPVVLTAHGSDAYATPYRTPSLRRAAMRALQTADRIVATSHFVRSHVAKFVPDDCAVVHNGADEALFAPRERAASRKALGLAPDRFILAFVGNLLEAKGVLDLAHAVDLIRDLRPLLLFAGDGPCKQRLSAMFRETGVDVRFLGRVKQTDLADIYGAADLVVLPTHSEGFPCVLAETLLAGRVLVATPVGGIPEVIRDGINGVLVPPHNPGWLAAALRDLHRRRGLTSEIEAAAHSYASKHLTWGSNAQEYEREYMRAVSE